MKITDMRTVTVSLPLRRPHLTGVRATERRFVIVRVDTDKGIRAIAFELFSRK